ncbi:MAG: protein tyrosine phosphatase [Verrucomicrobiota bacterium]
MAASFKILFVCSRNRRRSLTAERLYADFPGYEARSAGTQPEARIKVTPGLLGWADLVVCMEAGHLRRLRQKYPDVLAAKETVVLHIPDEFDYMNPALVDELLAALSDYVEVPDLPGA